MDMIGGRDGHSYDFYKQFTGGIKAKKYSDYDSDENGECSSNYWDQKNLRPSQPIRGSNYELNYFSKKMIKRHKLDTKVCTFLYEAKRKQIRTSFMPFMRFLTLSNHKT